MRARHCAVAAITLVVSVADPAAAHVVYDAKFKYQSHYYCSRVRAEISHGEHGFGYVKADSGAMTWAHTPWGEADCTAWREVEPGHLAVRWTLVKQRANGSTYACKWSDWTYNPKPTARYSVHWHVATMIRQGQWCGEGNYASYVGGFVWDVNESKWRGGWLWSGWHYLPV